MIAESMDLLIPNSCFMSGDNLLGLEYRYNKIKILFHNTQNIDMHSKWIPSGHVDVASLMAIDVRTYDEGDLITFNNY